MFHSGQTFVKPRYQQLRLTALGSTLAYEHMLRPSHRFVYVCLLCQATCKPQDPRWENWLVSPCTPNWVVLGAIRLSSNSPVDLDSRVRVLILGRAIHASHDLAVYRGLFFCKSCGRVASARLKALWHVCPKEATKAGSGVISALQKGQRPWGLSSWPDRRPIKDVSFIRL